MIPSYIYKGPTAIFTGTISNYVVPYKHIDSTYEGTFGNDEKTNFGNGRDVVYGNGGYDRFVTNDGDDKLVAGNNNGTWRGTGNEIGNSTTLDGGANNDDFTVSATKGAFMIVTGSGQDDVVIKGGDYVKIDNSGDTADAGDTYTFGPNFHGTADITSADTNDLLTLQGGGWGQGVFHDDGNKVWMEYDNASGGSVKLLGVSPGYVPEVHFA